MFIDGHGRKTLVEQIAVVSVTGSAGAALGVFDAGQYSRFTGLFSIIGSGTFRIQYGVNSASFLVSSTIAVMSGGSVLDFTNYSQHVRFSFSQLSSQAGASVLILGEPVR